MEGSLFDWVLLPLMIFAARVIDVTLGTLRIIFVSRGRRVLAPIMGFFEGPFPRRGFLKQLGLGSALLTCQRES